MKKKYTITNLLATKSFIGHKVGKNLGMGGLHPSMSSFSLGTRNNVSVLDIHYTLKNITKTLYIIFSIINKNGHVLVVNTNPEISNLVDYFAKKTEHFGNYFSYCNSKWVGGTLTNWNQIANSIAAYTSFSKRFGTFITRNNIYFPRYRKLKKCFQGFVLPRSLGHIANNEVKKVYLKKKNLTLKKPDILLVINPNENKNVLYEAKNLNIPVIALTDTNTDISFITYPIPVNNNSPFFIHYYLSLILRILESKHP